MRKGMTAALVVAMAVATLILGVPSGAVASAPQSSHGQCVAAEEQAEHDASEAVVDCSSGGAVGSAPQSSFGRCVAAEEQAEHDASEAVVDCSALD
jgi:hypothetical protein